MIEADLIPTPGHAFVGLNPMYGDYEENLAIPESARSKKLVGRIGQVCAVTPWPRNQLSWIYEEGRLVPRAAWVSNGFYTRMLGEYVICRFAQLLFGVLYAVRLEHMEAIVPESAKAAQDELGRCTRCKAPGGELGVLLGGDGYCPNCGFNHFGEHKDDEVLDAIGEYELDKWVRQPAEVAHVLHSGKALHGRVYSYPGQIIKRMPAVALDDELNDFMRHMKEKG